MNKYRMASLFAGVGGLDLGFELTGKFKTVWANEFDVRAAQTYKANFESTLVVEDIHNLDPADAPDFDILLAGFPCQAFSVAGYRKGFEDDRGDLFFEALRFIKAKQPEVVLLENVKNLVGHDNGNTFKVIREALEAHDYFLKYQVLNAKEYGNTPQNRERIYVIGFKNKEAFKNFVFPMPIPLEKSLKDIIDFDKELDEKYYYTKEKHTFYDKLENGISSQDTIYQWRRQYVRENKNGVVPTLTANMGTGGHNVPLVKTSNGIRKLTPRECFNAQGFPSDFILPELANSHLYKQAGNSVVVPVIKRIAEQISLALEEANITQGRVLEKR
ncbi:DNA cytosine methyltransferase [Exiguobacterium profundum]|uniref:DNA cytosine methyltransferase n=1 Tax=Exiguobacterium profundum TaxID=307643 RepID=UPI0029C4F726|nr:DNA cytosine methyltransferase [Exiguobacterium profundum]MDX5981309.1 DNA cytosine methyltransferase [Exiguobacterium profundum]